MESGGSSAQKVVAVGDLLLRAAIDFDERGLRNLLIFLGTEYKQWEEDPARPRNPDKYIHPAVQYLRGQIKLMNRVVKPKQRKLRQLKRPPLRVERGDLGALL